MKFFTKDKGYAVMASVIVITSIVLVLTLIYNRLFLNKHKTTVGVTNTVEEFAAIIQEKKSKLKASLKSEVTSKQTLDYLVEEGVIKDITQDIYNDLLSRKSATNDDSQIRSAYSNIANPRTFEYIGSDYDIRLYSNGYIVYDNQIKGQIILTDYYAQDEVKTIWSQETDVDNNTVKIQVYDGKFVKSEADNSYKVWKYALSCYDASTHGRFSYWINENQDVISTEPELYMSASINRNYTAVYDSEDYVEPGNRITMAYEKVGTGIVGCVEGMHYAKDITKKVYDPEAGYFKDYEIKGSNLDKIGIVFTLNPDVGNSIDFGCTSEDAQFTLIFDSSNPDYNSLVSYNYKNGGAIMISQAINITDSVLQSLKVKSGDTIYMKPFMLFTDESNGYYINAEKTYQYVY